MPVARFEEAHVVPRVPRRVGHFEIALAHADVFAAIETPEIGGRHGQKLTPQRLQLIPPKLTRAGHEAAGVGQVAHTRGVDEHLDVRVFRHERPGRAGVIEVDVGEQEGAEVFDGDPVTPERGGQRRQRRGRSGVDDRRTEAAVQHGRRNHLRLILESQVDVADVAGEPMHDVWQSVVHVPLHSSGAASPSGRRSRHLTMPTGTPVPA